MSRRLGWLNSAPIFFWHWRPSVVKQRGTNSLPTHVVGGKLLTFRRPNGHYIRRLFKVAVRQLLKRISFKRPNDHHIKPSSLKATSNKVTKLLTFRRPNVHHIRRSSKVAVKQLLKQIIFKRPNGHHIKRSSILWNEHFISTDALPTLGRRSKGHKVFVIRHQITSTTGVGGFIRRLIRDNTGEPPCTTQVKEHAL